ncbi:D-Ala-D-Ala dipeptidase VanX [Glycomyces tritici]|uniref:D-alanyl-D-alanine dipeptidase n=1 Tax=Glycomyces tritici TaxID=2665176 RepID=A0ABT7YT36_9ACTN|nr:D-Ala-D-Ala dipeptidase VanX [Glycomyces tritici]MDN3241534.1 D-Ala-D-Ala dipeptidase VanX [Glycomyces tritici]MDN3242321.1 D-Ala-D-Ala dipeptidase VanX [Glycomyces tritici]
MRDDFAYVDDAVPGIRWDATYATAENFIGAPVDGYLTDRVVGTRALCAALTEAQGKAASIGLGLLVWDAYRPQRAVDHFLRWAAQPEDGRTKAGHYPNIERSEMVAKQYVAPKSGHSRGSTVDLTLCRPDTGEPVPMGGHHDLMDPVSHHGASGITRVETANRALLRSIMEDCGFLPYQWEWWHYTLKNEPYPDTYFDFPVA